MTIETWFTSDTHFGHKNIIKYCNRPWTGAQQMDDALIANWNDRVADDDIVYHLGDFTLDDRRYAANVFRRLNGQIRVLGYHWHHDRKWIPDGYGPTDLTSATGHAVEILPPIVVLRVPEFGKGRHAMPITLSHYPLAEWEAKFHGGWHLHGHSHGNHKAPGKLLDAGVDVHGYAPIAMEDLPLLIP